MEDALSPVVDYSDVVRRRLPLSLKVGAFLLACTVALALGLPPEFKSKAVILIEQQDIPEDLVRSLNTSFADQRIQVISQRVLTSANLSAIIDKFDLYADERRTEPLEVIIEQMREDITVAPVSADIVDQRSGRPTKATIAVELAFENESPLTAQRVTNDVVSLFLSENLKQRTEAAEDTLEFLSLEADRLSETVSALEQQLADFKERHVNALPDLAQLNMQLLTRAEQDLVQVDNQIRSLEQQRVYLESELSQQQPTVGIVTSESGERLLGPVDRLKALEAEFVTLSARYGERHPDVIRMKREMESLRRQTGQGAPTTELAARARSLESDLATMKERYAAEHPDVRRLERELETVRSQLARQDDIGGGGIVSAGDPVPDNPVYVQLSARLDATEGEIQSLRAQAANLREKIGNYEERLTTAPQVEREYSALLREYEIAVAEYREVQAKRQEALLARSLEQDQKGERFTLIEPPFVPEEPSSPNRLGVALVGLMLSLVGGFGFGAAAEALDDRIYGRTGISNITGVPPLAAIPVLQNDSTRRSSNRKLIASILIFLAVVAVLAAAVHFLLSPIDVLYFRALRAIS